jgi:hypothetical protein
LDHFGMSNLESPSAGRLNPERAKGLRRQVAAHFLVTDHRCFPGSLQLRDAQSLNCLAHC